MELSTTLETNKIWKAVTADIQLKVSKLAYDIHISKMDLVTINEDTAIVNCPNKYTRDQVEKNFKEILHNSLQKISKKDLLLEFVIAKKINLQEPEETTKDLPLFNTQTQQNPKKIGLNPSYTFENYIMGNTNQLAYAIAQTISRDPGNKYNPFFVYAGVGLGKTHLIQAIGNKLIEDRPELNIIYCTGERFTNELIEALQRGRGKGGSYSSDSFRKKYRSADVLIIDDIQFIVGKESTQEEFFHTFNDLYMNNKQIVLASDRPPHEFKNIEERITSRFKSGMMADIQLPDYELRTAILRSKRDKEGDKVPNEVIDFIAENVQSNIRELEGTYLRVITHAMSQGKDIDVNIAKEELQDILPEKAFKPLNVNDIMKAVCNYYEVKQVDLKGKRRNKEIVIPRQVAMYLIYEITRTPYMSIGLLLGGRDHTTILHGYEKIRKELETSPQLRRDIVNIKNLSTIN